MKFIDQFKKAVLENHMDANTGTSIVLYNDHGDILASQSFEFGEGEFSFCNPAPITFSMEPSRHQRFMEGMPGHD